jgi:hypothetical protein
MKKWLVVGTVATLVGLGFYLAAAKRPAPAALDVQDIAINVTVGSPQVPPPAPVYLDRVVDVSDLDSLLDPPPIPVSEPRTHTGPVITRVGYEEPASPASARTNVPPIPMARDFDKPVICSEEEIMRME